MPALRKMRVDAAKQGRSEEKGAGQETGRATAAGSAGDKAIAIGAA